MKKILTVVLLCFTMSGCAMTDWLSPNKPSVEVNANVGKNVEQEKNNLKVEQGTTNNKQEAENISNDTKYEASKIENITQNIPIEYLLIAVLLGGWAIPSPLECYRGAKTVVADLFNGLIFKPIKGLMDFILILAGKQPSDTRRTNNDNT